MLSPAEIAVTKPPVANRHAARMVALMAVIFLLFLWSFVAFWSLSSYRESMESAEQVLRRMNHAVEEQTRRQFKMVEVFLGAVDQWVLDNPKADLRTDARFRRLVENFRNATDGAIDIGLVNENGGIVPIPQDGDAIAGEFVERDFLYNAPSEKLSAVQVGMPVVGPRDGLWHIPMAHRLTQKMPGAVAVIAAIQLPALLSLYEEERLRPNGAIVLLRRDGLVLARAPHDERLMGKSVASGQLYRDYLPKRDRGVVRLQRTATDAMDKLASYTVMNDFPLLMVVSASTDDVLESWWRDTLVILLLASGVTLVSVIAAVRLVRLLAELSQRNAELHHLATTDLMTGVNNRHHFMSLLYHEFARSRRYRQPLSLLVLDLDFFKQINDGYGHAAGDTALKTFAAAAGECLRGLDVIGRLGGEEFGILLPNTDVAQSAVVAERIRGAVARIAIETEFGTVRFTASIGVTETAEGDDSVDTLLARADAALYEAKAAGRNRVAVRKL